MSETVKHTPGPWEIGTETRGYEVCTIHSVTPQPTEDGLGQSWVYVYPPRVIDGEWHWPNEAEQFANARLIAAAPEMKAKGEALIEALAKFGFPVSEAATPALLNNGSREAQYLHAAAVAFADAIAKATGGSNA